MKLHEAMIEVLRRHGGETVCRSPREPRASTGIGERGNALKRLLSVAGCHTETPGFARPSTDNLDEKLYAEAIAAYRALGGMLARPRLRPGPWDAGCDGVAVELDEDLHFNRYRATTLRQQAYASLLGTVARIAVWEYVPVDGSELLVDALLRGSPSKAASRSIASLVRARATEP